MIFKFNERAAAVMELASKMRSVGGDWRERFDSIRHNYRLYGAAVERGIVSWGYPCDPHMIADWRRLLTPIELIAWDEIRSEGFPFWPQFPVSKYMVDFADPICKIALECDGSAYHDAERDANRDRELGSLGWKTLRIQGRDCYADSLVFADEFFTPVSLEELRLLMPREANYGPHPNH